MPSRARRQLLRGTSDCGRGDTGPSQQVFGREPRFHLVTRIWDGSGVGPAVALACASRAGCERGLIRGLVNSCEGDGRLCAAEQLRCDAAAGVRSRYEQAAAPFPAGEVPSSVRLPPVTANAPTAPILLSSTYSVRPSGLRRASTAPTPPVAPTGVLPSRVSAPPRAIE